MSGAYYSCTLKGEHDGLVHQQVQRGLVREVPMPPNLLSDLVHRGAQARVPSEGRQKPGVLISLRMQHTCERLDKW